MVSMVSYVGRVIDKLRKIELRLSEDDLLRVDNWRGEQRPIPNRNEAIRILLRLGLEKVETKGKEQ